MSTPRTEGGLRFIGLERLEPRGRHLPRSDTIAERMRAVRAVPDGRSDTVSATTTLSTFPAGELSTTDVVALVGDRLIATVATVRQAHDEVDADDPASADLLHAVIDNLQKYLWMVSAEDQQARQVQHRRCASRTAPAGTSPTTTMPSAVAQRSPFGEDYIVQYP